MPCTCRHVRRVWQSTLRSSTFFVESYNYADFLSYWCFFCCLLPCFLPTYLQTFPWCQYCSWVQALTRLTCLPCTRQTVWHSVPGVDRQGNNIQPPTCWLRHGPSWNITSKPEFSLYDSFISGNVSKTPSFLLFFVPDFCFESVIVHLLKKGPHKLIYEDKLW